MPAAANISQIITRAERKLRPWRDRAEAVEARYEDERSQNSKQNSKARKLNIFWSSLEILKPALYSRTPSPQIERRFGSGDVLARLAAEILTRAVAFFLSEEKFDDNIKAARDDWKIAGLGQVWPRYEPVYGDALAGEDGAPRLDEQGKALREVVYERVTCEHVRHRDFGYWPFRCWEEVKLVWRPVFMSKERALERFGPKASALSFDRDPDAGDDEASADAGDGDEREARILEVWDKERRVVLWINPKAKGAEAVLDEKPDPYGLRDFFPCPRPLFATLQRGAMIPIPDYYYQQDQADQIDDATDRVAELVKMVQLRGAYNKGAKELAKIFNPNASGNKVVAVDNWAHFMGQQGGLKGNMELLELEPVTEAIAALLKLRAEFKNDLYETTGISDIVRGASDPSETLGAQRMKGQFAGLRLQDQQGEMARFARDVLCIVAELISEHFQPDTLAMLTGLTDPAELANVVGEGVLQGQAPAPGQAGQQGAIAAMAGPDQELAAKALFQQACELLKGDVLRTFKIDIETDSTVADTIQADQEQAEKLLQAVNQVLSTMVQVAQAAPPLLPMFKEILMMTLRKYRVGRALEGRIEDSLEKAIGAVSAKPPGGDGDQKALIQQAAKMLQTYKDKLASHGLIDPEYEATLKGLLAQSAGGAQPPPAAGAQAPAMPAPGGAPN